MIVLLNGPPGSGKDTLADILVKRNWLFQKRRFKDALVDIAAAVYRVTPAFINEKLEDRIWKETPTEIFDGLSLRQALIKVSEDMIKPMYGNDYFGVSCAKTMNPQGNYVISDAGFESEANVLIDKFGKDDVVLIQLSREGHDFSNDSRSYLNNLPVETFRIGNHDSIEIFFEKFNILINNLINSRMDKIS